MTNPELWRGWLATSSLPDNRSRSTGRFPPLLTKYIKHDARDKLMKERNVLFKTHSTRFMYGYTVEEHSDSERGNPLPPIGLLFPISSKGSFICTYHDLCYTSGETPAERRNSSMGPP